MPSIWDVEYIVTDVETTGSDPIKDRITELAAVITGDGEIKEEFSSLINPHKYIPQFIVQMTGITNEMVFRAPEAREVLTKANRIFNKPDGIFVAHNASFDWGFVQETYKREEFELADLPRLDTLKLARRLLPKQQKKNVGALAAYFGIPVRHRHRAFGDAIATAHILNELMQMAEQEHNISDIEELLLFQNKTLRGYVAEPPALSRVEEKLEALPQSPGVYYFLGKKENILYVGKAKCLRERVHSYFQRGNINSRKIAELLKKIHNIEWRETGSELEALILESKEIKRLQPKFNTLDRRYRRYPFIKIPNDTEFPRLETVYSIDDDGAEYFGPFKDKEALDEIVVTIEKQFKIKKCDKNINPAPGAKPCMYFQMEQCGAPCNGSMSQAEYEEELRKLKKFLNSCGDGIVTKLKHRMSALADSLDFEKAAAIRDQIAEIKKLFVRHDNETPSINNNNVIVALPNSPKDKTVDIYLIRAGKLCHQETIGRKAPVNGLADKVHNLYFNGSKSVMPYSIEDVNELKIVSSWVYRQKESGTLIYIKNKKEKELFDELVSAIRKMEFEDEPELKIND